VLKGVVIIKRGRCIGTYNNVYVISHLGSNQLGFVVMAIALDDYGTTSHTSLYQTMVSSGTPGVAGVVCPSLLIVERY
jgi:hypothetical protein